MLAACSLCIPLCLAILHTCQSEPVDLWNQFDALLNTDLFSGRSISSRNGKDLNLDPSSPPEIVEELKHELSRNASLNEVYLRYKKIYNVQDDSGKSVSVFKQNLIDIASHNALAWRGLVEYEKGVNQFTHEKEQVSFQENLIFHEIFKRPRNDSESDAKPLKSWFNFRKGRNFKQDNFLDWRQYGVVTIPKHQGKCGSCTLFAATGALESHHLLVKLFTKGKGYDYDNQNQGKTGKSYSYGQGQGQAYSVADPDLSEQELLDCTKNYTGYAGCVGNLPIPVLEYMRDKGVSYERDYPYQDKVGDACFAKQQSSSFHYYLPKVKFDQFRQVTPGFDETVLKSVVRQFGPVITWMFMSQDLKMYRSGIYSTKCVGAHGLPQNVFRDHLVLIVGYGSEWVPERREMMDYWIVKNSYGRWWGEEGYFRIERNKRLCLIGDEAYYLYSNPPGKLGGNKL